MPHQDFPPSIAVPATSIDAVIAQLGDIVDWARARHSRLGYFAALYRKVTVRVKQGIAAGEFEDAARMERLDVIFANRYVQALHQQLSGGRPSESWVRAFEAAQLWRPVVLQHLLLGMNAHINLDLGIAAAETVPAAELPALQGDFDRINELLASLVGGVQEELAEIWPLLDVADDLLGSVEETLINFSMEKAREAAWDFALQLAPLQGAARAQAIAERDGWISNFSRVIQFPGLRLSAVLLAVKLGERGSIAEQIAVLE